MDTSVSIRVATAADNDVLAQLGRQTFEQAFHNSSSPEDMAAFLKSTFSPEIQATELADPQCIFWLVLLDEVIMGYVKLHTGPAPPCIFKSKALKISRFYLLQEWCGKGIGNQLLNKVMEYARQQEFEVIWLTVWEHNAGAFKLYQKHGFRIVGDEDFVIGLDVQHDFIMERVLN